MELKATRISVLMYSNIQEIYFMALLTIDNSQLEKPRVIAQRDRN